MMKTEGWMSYDEAVNKLLRRKYMREYMDGRKDRLSIYERIRARDNYKCQLCGAEIKNENKTALHVHHKDGNRKNNKGDNLITLCPFCHINTHKKWGSERMAGRV